MFCLLNILIWSHSFNNNDASNMASCFAHYGIAYLDVLFKFKSFLNNKHLVFGHLVYAFGH